MWVGQDVRRFAGDTLLFRPSRVLIALRLRIDLIQNQHHFAESLIFIWGLVRRGEGNDLLRRAVVDQREILCG